MAELERIYKDTDSGGWGWVTQEATGGLAGASRVLGPFPFAFDTPGLADGVEFYTPTVGDILLDVWIEVVEAFDGTTPLADVATFVGQTAGLFEYNSPSGPIDLTQADVEDTGEGYLFNGDGSPSLAQSVLLSFNGAYQTDAIAATPADPAPFVQKPAIGVSAFARTPRMAMGRFTAANPLKIVASQDGSVGGDPIGGTTGAASVYIVVATPSLT